MDWQWNLFIVSSRALKWGFMSFWPQSWAPVHQETEVNNYVNLEVSCLESFRILIIVVYLLTPKHKFFNIWKCQIISYSFLHIKRAGVMYEMIPQHFSRKWGVLSWKLFAMNDLMQPQSNVTFQYLDVSWSTEMNSVVFQLLTWFHSPVASVSMTGSFQRIQVGVSVTDRRCFRPPQINLLQWAGYLPLSSTSSFWLTIRVKRSQLQS